MSLVYKNIWGYRLVMNALYLGRYSLRFTHVISCIESYRLKETKVLELCSGDIYIAKWAHSVGLGYIGFDVNYRFVRYAVKRGFDVRLVDLNKVKQFPDASIAVMMGSLYHFHYNLKDFVDRVMASVKRFIISEPIRNLSQTAGILGWIAQRSANVGKGNESFRYDESGLIEALIKVCGDVYLCKVLMRDRKDIIIEILWK